MRIKDLREDTELTQNEIADFLHIKQIFGLADERKPYKKKSLRAEGSFY